MSDVRPSLRLWPIVIAAVASMGGPVRSDADDDSNAAGRQAVERGVRWLIGRQHDDGGWRSTTYGQMRGGVGNTSLAVYGLAASLASDDRVAHAAARRGAQFLLRNLAAEGYVRDAAGDSDYPTYGTALLLASLPRLAVDVAPETVADMQAYLLSAQLRSDDAEFGGWHQTGGFAAEWRKSGASNISATRVALESLAAGNALRPDVRDAALAYLVRCQNFGATKLDDGGFFFKPDPTDAFNKAGMSQPTRARSYGSATVDGLLALVACGAPTDSPRRQAAVAWLNKHFDADDVPGFASAGDRRSLAAGLYYYYAAGLASALRRAPELDSPPRRAALVRALVRRQRADGSWQNPSPAMQEDDPLVATSLAIAALATLIEADAPQAEAR